MAIAAVACVGSVACSEDGSLEDGAEPVGVAHQPYGEPQNGFPSWYERMIHVMVNRARSDPQADLAGCSNCAESACYSGPRNPVEWYYDHARGARFHATNLTSAQCGMLHDSPCQLVANIGSLYPGTCDGTEGCACQGGNAACSGGTTWSTRLSAFGVTGTIAENIAGMGDPKTIFYQWLWEPTSNTACSWTVQNGHRYNILNNAYRRLGVGGAGNYTVQDFSGQGTLTQKIPAAAHYPQTGTNLEMRLNWYSTTAASAAYVNVDGTCTPLSVERGSATNGTYLGNVSVPSGCHAYYFIVVDASGANTTYPTTGSFGVGCPADWSNVRPAEGSGCPNAVPCGNGVLDPGETCDPPSSCPSSCSDGNACTTDAMSGSASTCNVSCTHTPVTTCMGGNACCPAGCNANNDSDCSVSCGNGVVEAGETCDPASSCPTCNDGNACTTDSTTGSSATCNVACGYQPIVACGPSEGCCPAGCNANGDPDCSVSCGNGVVEAGETCDPPGTCPATCNDGNACTIDVLTGNASTCNAACGHTVVASCADGDGCCPAGCDATSDADCSAMCGNGTVEAGESCDPPGTCPTDCDDSNACTIDALTGSSANCNASCTQTAIVTCADGDGCCPAGCDATTDGDCSETCGNGTVERGETCDPQETCPTTCDDNDACTQDTETGSVENCNVACGHTQVVSCEAGDGCCPAGCTEASDADCAVVCGNRTIDPGETCDPPESCPTACDDGDACTNDVLTGDPAACTSECKALVVALCEAGDGCCPEGCTAQVDADCGQGSGGGEGDTGDSGDGSDDGCLCTSAGAPARPSLWPALLLAAGFFGFRRRTARQRP